METSRHNAAAAARTPAPAERVTKSARLRWPIIVAGLLLTHAGALLIAVKIAQGDPSQNGNRIDPRYYERDARGASPDVQPPPAEGGAAEEAGPR